MSLFVLLLNPFENEFGHIQFTKKRSWISKVLHSNSNLLLDFCINFPTYFVWRMRIYSSKINAKRVLATCQNIDAFSIDFIFLNIQLLLFSYCCVLEWKKNNLFPMTSNTIFVVHLKYLKIIFFIWKQFKQKIEI